MKCEVCQEKMTSLLFGEMPEDDAIKYHEHMAECEVCRDLYIELVETQSTLERGLKQTSESGLSADQKKKILAHTELPPLKPVKFPYWLVAAAACMVIVLVVSQTNKSENLAKETPVQNDSVTSKPKALEENKAVSEEAENDILADSIEMKDVNQRSVENKVQTLKAQKAKAETRELSEPAPEMLMEKQPKVEAPKKSARRKMADKKEEVQSFASGLALADENQHYSLDNLITKLKAFLKQDGLNTDQKALAEKILDSPEAQVKPQIEMADKGKNSTEIKILVRILNKDKKTIDSARIYIHNQKIIRLERVSE